MIARTRVADGIWFLEPEDMRGFRACAGLWVRRGGRSLLVDANMGAADTPGLIEEVRADRALLTHYHLDHFNWAPQAAEAGARVWMPRIERPVVASVDAFVARTAGPSGRGEAWTEFAVHATGFRPLTDCSGFDPGDVFDAGGLRLEAVAAPGHSPAHTAFYFPAEKILFTGDMGLDRFGPWYGWQDCDLVQSVESIRRLRGMDVRLALTSHGGSVAGADLPAAWDRAVARIVGREERVRRALEAGQTREAIVAEGIFFKNKDRTAEPLRGFLYMWDACMFDHHRKVLDQGGLRRYFPELADGVRRH